MFRRQVRGGVGWRGAVGGWQAGATALPVAPDAIESSQTFQAASALIIAHQESCMVEDSSDVSMFGCWAQMEGGDDIRLSLGLMRKCMGDKKRVGGEGWVCEWVGGWVPA